MFVQRICIAMFALALAAIGILLTPSVAWAAKTIKATNSAACTSSQATVGVTYIITNIASPPNITVYLVSSTITIAPDVQAAPIGNTHHYSADVTAPVDRNRPATASVPSSWSGTFEFDSVTCQDAVSTPSPTVANGATASANRAATIAPPSRTPSALPSVTTLETPTDDAPTDDTFSSSDSTAPFVANNKATPKDDGGMSFASIMIMLFGATMVILGAVILFVILRRKRDQDDDDD